MALNVYVGKEGAKELYRTVRGDLDSLENRVDTELSGKESVGNKVSSWSGITADSYPAASLVKSEVDRLEGLIGNIGGFDVVGLKDGVPDVAEPKHTLIYLTHMDGVPGDDKYKEWIYGQENEWEVIGETSVDLSQYYTKTEADTLLGQKADRATTLAGYSITDAYTKTEVDLKFVAESLDEFPLHRLGPDEVEIAGRVYRTATINGAVWLGENYYWDATGADQANVRQDNKYNTYFNTDLVKSQAGLGKWVPAGWHLPTVAEWDALVDYVCGTGAERDLGKLKDLMSVDDYHYVDARGNGNTNLNLQPGGMYTNKSHSMDTNAIFWTASQETLSPSTGAQQIAVSINTYYLKDGMQPDNAYFKDSYPINQSSYNGYRPVRLVKDA